MAIFHFTATMVCRSRGHSVVQVAASRSGSFLYDERTGRTKRPVRQETPIWSTVILVPGAPGRWRDRAVLWNDVELREKRVDAGLAREIHVALPVELPLDMCVALAQQFAEQVFVQSGMIVDLNVRADCSDSGQAWPWASLLLTTRQVSLGVFGGKVRVWNDRARLVSWREQWAAFANRALVDHGFLGTLDHRSNHVRGIDLEPQNKIGPAAMRRARAGEVMERVVEHKEIAERNSERKRNLSRQGML